MKKLSEKYDEIIMQYIRKFAEKQELQFETFDLSRDIAFFANDYIFTISDIRHDIDSDKPKGLIVQWSDDSTENYPKKINYFSYGLGLRFEHLNNKS